MDNRIHSREDLQKQDPREIIIEIDSETKLEGTATDISLSGIGVLFPHCSEEHVAFMSNNTDFMVRLLLDKEIFLMTMNFAWHSRYEGAGQNSYIGGLRFETISKEDNLRLSGLIDKIRNDTPQ